MKSRLSRLAKLTELRKKDLEDRAARLAAAHQATEQARERLVAEEAAHRQAEADRSALAQSGLEPETWRTANEWLELRELYREAARRRVALAEVAALRAQEQVLAARAALRRLEVLEERLKRALSKTEERKESKAHDEIAAGRAAARARTR
ncbi:MAG: flagellar FliJ family protein [Deltaproteobacteria bacterium]|jgi:flagellar export protein FliJ|nr:flagellar FliJ family protein [Deltaproteobacteria bacterium]